MPSTPSKFRQLTFSPTVKFHLNLLVHVLCEIENILLLGFFRLLIGLCAPTTSTTILTTAGTSIGTTASTSEMSSLRHYIGIVQGWGRCMIMSELGFDCWREWSKRMETGSENSGADEAEFIGLRKNHAFRCTCLLVTSISFVGSQLTPAREGGCGSEERQQCEDTRRHLHEIAQRQMRSPAKFRGS